jgi:hypothetical protein
MSRADTVNTWFRERLATGALARDTPAYNQVAAALPDLIGRLTVVDPAIQTAHAALQEADAALQAAENAPSA